MSRLFKIKSLLKKSALITINIIGVGMAETMIMEKNFDRDKAIKLDFTKSVNDFIILNCLDGLIAHFVYVPLTSLYNSFATNMGAPD